MLNLPSPCTVGCSLYLPLSEHRKNVISEYAPEQTLDIDGVVMTCKDFGNLKTDVWDPSCIKRSQNCQVSLQGSDGLVTEYKLELKLGSTCRTWAKWLIEKPLF